MDRPYPGNLTEQDAASPHHLLPTRSQETPELPKRLCGTYAYYTTLFLGRKSGDAKSVGNPLILYASPTVEERLTTKDTEATKKTRRNLPFLSPPAVSFVPSVVKGRSTWRWRRGRLWMARHNLEILAAVWAITRATAVPSAAFAARAPRPVHRPGTAPGWRGRPR